MNVVLTVCGEKHRKFLPMCKASVEKVDAEHRVYVGTEPKAYGMNYLLNGIRDDDNVGLLDADDWCTRNWFDAVGQLDEYDLIYGDYIAVTGDTYETKKSREFDYDLFKKQCFIPFSSVILKGWLAKSAIYPNRTHGNDWEYWWRLLQVSKNFKYVPRVCYHYRTWTGYKKSNIPVYRVLKRLYLNHRVKQDLKKYHENR